MSTTTSRPRASNATTRRGDRYFAGASRLAGYTILATLAGVAIFLTVNGLPAISAPADKLDGKHNIVLYVWPLLFGTLLSGAIALLIATPLAIGVALLVSHYSPRYVAVPAARLLDLLAAIPSVVYGLWGIGFLGPRLVPFFQWAEKHLGWLPIFEGPSSTTGRTILTASVVLAIMVLPIISAISREIFVQTPKLNEEAALALGATKWEMIRYAVLPHARPGIVSAVMLGLGRAMGETMAVAMVLSATGIVSFNLISSSNPSTIAANVALRFSDATGLGVNALIFSGLVLFVITFAVNFAARALLGRARWEGRA